MKQPTQLLNTNSFVTNPRNASRPLHGCVLLVVAAFCVCPDARAVSPAPDGAYPGDNTAEGAGALFSLSSGVNNTALGTQALFHDTNGSFNSATGAFALFNNTSGSSNTADGFQALFSNTGGFRNTATGTGALFRNNASYNTAVGWGAMFNDTTGDLNTADGAKALNHNTNGFRDNAVGYQALLSNTSGFYNNAVGVDALILNTAGAGNNAVGDAALANNVTGNGNTAIGDLAGLSVTGSGNVCIGADVLGAAGENNVTRIRNIGTTPQNTGIYVTLDAVGGRKLGYVNVSSSRRFKEDIRPMDNASEAVYALKPVHFRYKKQFDPDPTMHFGLVAEDVEEVNPDLVARNARGELTTVRYEAINAMLLNEFLKEHEKVQRLETALAALNNRLEQQDAKIEKVSAKIELTRASPAVAENK
jgi:hypothetical protein